MKKKLFQTQVAAASAAVPVPGTVNFELIDKEIPTNPPSLGDSLKNGSHFFYLARITRDFKKFRFSEYGYASVKKLKSKTTINRLDSLYCVYESGLPEKTGGQINKIKLQEGETLLVSTFVPNDLKSLFVIPNSALCCSDKYKPTPIELQNNTLLGMYENVIQSIDQNELWSILLNNNKKPVEGSIRYNKKDKCFEGYTGERWRALMWGEE